MWPVGLGFEYFYGFIGGDTSQWAPAIIENTKPIEPPHDDPNYNFDRDMADKAIQWIRMQKAVAPGTPFFAYYAPGTAHAPHHAPKEWIAKFNGKFDQGWDKQREMTFAKQKEMGVIPANTKLTKNGVNGDGPSQLFKIKVYLLQKKVEIPSIIRFLGSKTAI